MKPLPPLKVLAEVFSYDPETGVLVWRRTGRVAGWVEADGYRRVKLHGSSHRVHRICYALHHGADPFPLEVDHLNRVKSDNRACNLRAVTAEVNRLNGVPDRPVRVGHPNGEVFLYPSVNAAARGLGCSRSTVRRHALGQHPHPAGLSVVYAPAP